MKFYRHASLRIRIRKGNFSGYEDPPLYITGLRVSFSIIKSIAWSTNSGIVKIWNLSNDHRNLIKDYGDEVTVYAGYIGSPPTPANEIDGPQILYIGDTTAVSHVYDFPEIVSILECGTQERFLNQRRVSFTYSANTPARTVLRGIADQMGIPIIQFADSDNLVYRQGVKFIGMGKDALALVANKLGLVADVQDQGLYIYPKNGTIVQPIVPINENTGMIGVPQRFTYKSLDLYSPITGPNVLAATAARAAAAPFIPPSRPTGYKVNTTLNPSILPGSLIELTSTHLNYLNGRNKVLNVRHEGDTFGFSWASQLEVVAV
jgi:hypothetical protein